MYQQEFHAGMLCGLPDISVKEAKERVKTAIKNSNVEFQNKKALELQRERLELISILKRLKSSCEDSISDKLLEVEEKIKTEPLKRVLRKKEKGR